MSESLLCWSCGIDLAALSSPLTLPLSRLDQCPSCSNYLHVCRMCSFYDPQVAEACREDDAEEVKEKERVNFCDFFRPAANAYDPLKGRSAEQAKSELAELFSDSVPDDSTLEGAANDSSDELQAAANKLFDDD